MLLGDKRLWLSNTHHKKITFPHANDLDSIQLQHIVFQNWPEASNLVVFFFLFFFLAA